jgi:50S ribosome-binding GTPase/Domain of unknown function (DUF3482)
MTARPDPPDGPGRARLNGSAADSGVHTVSLSLVSHTNVGKTTLARTLLGRDIGEVRDQAHVTQSAEAHVLVATDAGDRLLLWDTPGFGDSVRLARRLAQAGNPLGWLLSQLWDRWRDRPFWATQQAVRHVLGQADVVLYLVNASELPQEAGYLDAELQVLALLGKPVVAVLNQLGPAGNAEEPALAQAVARWQSHLAARPVVRAVLTLDAFSRCWVHEGVLWNAVAELLPPDRRPAFGRLQAVWAQSQQARWQQAMAELSRRLARAAVDREPVPAETWRGRLGAWAQLLGRRGDGPPAATERAMAALAARLDADVRLSTDRLIALHGLEGEAGQEVLTRLARHYAVRQPLDEGRAAVWGGLVTGALAGLKADLATGGLTLGGGLLAGGVLGALSAAGAARGVNHLRGVDAPEVAWDAAVLDMLLANALLGYLAVAHHGRGRGTWVATEPPSAWTDSVAAVVAEHHAAFDLLWRRRAMLFGPVAEGESNPSLLAWQGDLQRQVQRAGDALLKRLYPVAGW